MPHFKKATLMIWLALAVVLLISACGKIEDLPAGADLMNGLVKQFTVHARSSGFDVQEIKVKKGDIVKITLKNEQGMHSLKIKGYNKEVRGGKTITFVADKAGEFVFSCNTSCGKNHKQMTGKFIVK